MAEKLENSKNDSIHKDPTLKRAMSSLKTRNFSLNKEPSAPTKIDQMDSIKVFDQRESKISVKTLKHQLNKTTSSLKMKNLSPNKKNTAKLKELLSSLNTAKNQPMP